ncbi:hypothetical protein [uncultured Aquimarina sp.]|uniref:hypothetical protein n=1 Tax=uncultured Aquimarina sp. TaxID=575652 RepID=UPI002624B07E|nr:hypothetical protein [uncultured Aquimarina sp.]
MKHKIFLEKHEIEEILLSDKKYIDDKEAFITYRKIRFILNNACTNPEYWMQYKPYYKDYLFDNDNWNLIAKTHSVFSEIIQLKKELKIIDIHNVYITLKSVIFQTKNYKYFTQKILRAEKEGINETLIHDFKRFGREPYKLTPLIKNRIKYYYALPRKYSYKKISDLVNNELISRNIKTISYSTVKRVISNQELKNIADPLRFGKQYAKDNIYSYITRKKPKNSGDVLEIDSTVLNFLLKDEKNEFYKLWLCAVIDVSSGKILGYSFDKSENTGMTLKCLKKSFQTLKVIPKMIVHDRHQCYLSEKFKTILSKMSDFGIIARQCKSRNPRDKGHIERWFDTLKGGYLKYEIGYIGDSITSSREGGRVNSDLEKLYSKIPFIKNENEVKRLISLKVKEYNNSILTKGKSPNQLFKKQFDSNRIKFIKGNLSYIFLEEKFTTVRNSKIFIKQQGKIHTYPIDNSYLSNRINRTTVIIRYDKLDLSKIDVFDKTTDKYQGTLYVEEGINIILDSSDKSKLKKHIEARNQRIIQNLDDLNSDLDEGWEELRSIPIISMEKDFESLEKASRVENEILLSNVYPIKKVKHNKFKTRKSSSFLKFKGKNEYKEVN